MTEIRKMLSIKDVLAIAQVSRSTLEHMEADGRFPRGRMLSAKCEAWFEDEVVAWAAASQRAKG